MANASGTLSAPTQPGQALYQAVANFLTTGDPTLTSGGARPPGGWTHIEDYVSNGTTYSVWKSSGASNTAKSDWYVCFQYQATAGSTVFYVWMFESYDSTTHEKRYWAFRNTGSSGMGLASATTPPWAYSGAAVGVGSGGDNEYSVNLPPSAGTTHYLIAANADGFFLATSVSGSVYAGSGDSLVSSTVGDPVPLFLVGAGATNSAPSAGSTRDPGDGGGYEGDYNVSPFIPGVSNAATYMGTVNGTGGDAYQGSVVLSARGAVIKTGNNTPQIGVLRGLLPAWLQYVHQSGVAFADTLTEGTDGMVFADCNSPATIMDTTTA